MSATGLNAALQAAVAPLELEARSTEIVHALAESISAARAKTDEYRAASKARRDALSAGAELPPDTELLTPPIDVLNALDDATRVMRSLYFDLAELSAFILSKMPEIKEEDNAGVNVQNQVMEALGDLRRRIQSPKDDTRSLHLGSKQEYLSKRYDLEMKLQPSDEKARVPASQSLRRAIAELDALTVGGVAAFFADMVVYLVGVCTLFTRNVKKIREPRREGHGMIS